MLTEIFVTLNSLAPTCIALCRLSSVPRKCNNFGQSQQHRQDLDERGTNTTRQVHRKCVVSSAQPTPCVIGTHGYRQKGTAKVRIVGCPHLLAGVFRGPPAKGWWGNPLKVSVVHVTTRDVGCVPLVGLSWLLKQTKFHKKSFERSLSISTACRPGN